MRTILCYDVVADKRRARLHKKLRAHLVPVQKSVFEGDADAAGLKALERIVHRECDLGVDAVRVYHLCAACAATLKLFGVSEPIAGPDAPQVF